MRGQDEGNGQHEGTGGEDRIRELKGTGSGDRMRGRDEGTCWKGRISALPVPAPLPRASPGPAAPSAAWAPPAAAAARP